jgi:hypothetical protein
MNNVNTAIIQHTLAVKSVKENSKGLYKSIKDEPNRVDQYLVRIT